MPAQPAHRVGRSDLQRELARRPAQPASGRVPPHPQLPQVGTIPLQLVRRQRVGDLVGQHDAGHRLDLPLAGGILDRDDVVQPDLDHRRHRLGHPVPVDVAQAVAHRRTISGW